MQLGQRTFRQRSQPQCQTTSSRALPRQSLRPRFKKKNITGTQRHDLPTKKQTKRFQTGPQNGTIEYTTTLTSRFQLESGTSTSPSRVRLMVLPKTGLTGPKLAFPGLSVPSDLSLEIETPLARVTRRAGVEENDFFCFSPKPAPTKTLRPSHHLGHSAARTHTHSIHRRQNKCKRSGSHGSACYRREKAWLLLSLAELLAPRNGQGTASSAFSKKKYRGKTRPERTTPSRLKATRALGRTPGREAPRVYNEGSGEKKKESRKKTGSSQTKLP